MKKNDYLIISLCYDINPAIIYHNMSKKSMAIISYKVHKNNYVNSTTALDQYTIIQNSFSNGTK